MRWIALPWTASPLLFAGSAPLDVPLVREVVAIVLIAVFR